ncbi:hypothetical protein LTR56_012706 [Elasticomyces elasticus]|nr:hypothetical protein LTR56_012706 [Elasticomyces elasticus]KAK4918763.1 hypothetical protein LTR49_013550 [Elasticomyces elasticus]KAK5754408.1 hypothetical protein LTS12_015477 [Elasticomyces elasticus]
MFMGTPHRGSDSAYWGRILGNIGNIPMLASLRTDLLKDLKPRSTTLGDICSQFVERATTLHIITLYERQKITGLPTLIVDKDSAVLHLPNEEPIPIEANHISMCKVRSSGSNMYEMLSDCIDRLVESARGDIEQIYENTKIEILRHFRPPTHDPLMVLKTLAPAYKHTCTWLLHDPSFRSWCDVDEVRILWVHGRPGIGKTMLSRFILCNFWGPSSRLQKGALSTHASAKQQEIITLHYFFNRARLQQGHDPLLQSQTGHFAHVTFMVLSELICQLVESDSTLLRWLPKEHQSRTINMTADERFDFLQRVVTQETGPNIRILLDGLDEMEGNCAVEIVEIMSSLAECDNGHRLKIVLTDRRPVFWPLTGLDCDRYCTLEVGGSNVADDVEIYIHGEVEKFVRTQKIPRRLVSDIEGTIIAVADGTFLRAKLALANFMGNCSVWNEKRVQARLNAVQRMTPDLETFYCGLLRLIPDDFASHAKRIFAIMCVAATNVSVGFLQYAITISEEHESLEELNDDLAFNLDDKIQQFCGYILRVENGVVHFCHKSAQDLFNSAASSPTNLDTLKLFRSSQSEDHRILAALCLDVFRLRELRFPEVKRTLWADDPDNQSQGVRKNQLQVSKQGAARESSLFCYAIRFWEVHYAHCEPDDTMVQTFFQYLSRQDARHIYSYRKECYPGTAIADLDGEAYMPTLRLIIAYGDFTSLMKQLHKQEVNVNEVYADTTALCSAVSNKRFAVAHLLLDNPHTSLALPYGRSRPLHRAMDVAMEPGGYEILKRLLYDSRTDVNAVDSEGDTVCHILMRCMAWDLPDSVAHKRKTYEDVWNDLISVAGTDFNGTNKRGETPLMLSFNDRIEQTFVLKLLRQPETMLDPYSATNDGVNWLSSAAELGWDSVEDELLSRYPWQLSTLVFPDGHNTLTSCAYNGRKAQLLKLLGHIPPDKLAPLLKMLRWDLASLCAQQDWEDVLLLLENRFAVSLVRPDHMLRTMLHWAVENQWQLGPAYERQASIPSSLNARDRDGKTAFHLAADHADYSSARWLFDRGADYMVIERYGRNAVHAAADVCSIAILRMFLTSTTREFRRDYHGRSLLHYLVKWSPSSLIKDFCTSKRMIIDVYDRDRRTPLHYAALYSNFESAVALVDLGATVDRKDGIGFSALHYATRNGNFKLVNYLLDNGASPNALNRHLQNVQQLAAISGNMLLVQSLVQQASYARHRDRFGRSSFHILARKAASGHSGLHDHTVRESK